ncbi:MAG TPA: transcriptional regulator GcvA [Usitatibacter sp.]|jgi:LysR family glycine cleavage system transcriptional activator|nr:transcriptional regulator GcvA [Usitatibacter sp.]
MPRNNGRLPPLNALRAFEAAARHLSFKKASRELHVTPGAIGHQVKLLEDHLGAPLFVRLTRALELTGEAHAMLPKVREGLDALHAAVQRAREREQTHALAVVSPPNFAARWLVPRLGRFAEAHPEIELHLASRQEMVDGGDGDSGSVPEVDAPAHAPIAMVRFGSGHYPGARADEVFSAVYVPVCSPKLLGGAHPLRAPEDLRHHTLLHDDTVVEEGARPSWGDWLGLAGVSGIDATRGPHFGDAALALDAALEGLGVTLAIRSLLTPEIKAKRLVVPFGIAAPTGYAYYLVTPDAAAQDPAVRSFRSWLLEEAAGERAS